MFPLTPKCVATLIARCHLSVSAAGLANTCRSSASSCVRQTLFDLENIPRRYILASWRCCYRLSGHICGAIVSHLSLNEQVLCWGLTNIKHHAHCTGTRTRAHIHGPSSVACMLGGVTISFCSGSLYHRKGNRWSRWERASRPVFVQRSGVSSKPPAETVDRWKKSFTDSQVPRKRAVGL